MTKALDHNDTTIPFRFDTIQSSLINGECVNDP